MSKPDKQDGAEQEWEKYELNLETAWHNILNENPALAQEIVRRVGERGKSFEYYNGMFRSVNQFAQNNIKNYTQQTFAILAYLAYRKRHATKGLEDVVDDSLKGFITQYEREYKFVLEETKNMSRMITAKPAAPPIMSNFV